VRITRKGGVAQCIFYTKRRGWVPSILHERAGSATPDFARKDTFCRFVASSFEVAGKMSSVSSEIGWGSIGPSRHALGTRYTF